MNKSGMFAAYWGAKVKALYADEGYDIGVMQSVEKDRIYLMHNAYSSFCLIENCKLILTPLSQITTDDANYIVSLCGWDSKENVIDCLFDSFGKLRIEFEMHTYKVTVTPHIIDYLRSKSYDLGYMDCENLINAGYAIVADKQ